MTLPTSGPISMAQVRQELGLSGPISMGDPKVRTLFGQGSGTISMSHGRGKSDVPVIPPPTLSFRRTIDYADGYRLDYEYNVGGTGVSTSAGWISGGAYLSISKLSTTVFSIIAGRENRTLTGTIRVTASNAGGSVSVDRAVTMYYTVYHGCCFTGDSLVTMADGSHRRIDQIAPDDWIKTPFGQSQVDWIRLPLLEDRELLALDGGVCKTSGEHGMWTLDKDTGDQWWSTRNMERWLYERDNNLGPGLNGSTPWDLIEQGKKTAHFATEAGWQEMGWSVVEDAPSDTQLYHLYLKDHASYFVDGFLVIGELPRHESLIDWTTFTWNPDSPVPPTYMDHGRELPPIFIGGHLTEEG